MNKASCGWFEHGAFLTKAFSLRSYITTVLMVMTSTSSFASTTQVECKNISVDEVALRVSRDEYVDRLHGFWLGQSIGNWTGLSTEMVKVDQPFYTDEDWGRQSEPSVWGFYAPHTAKIDFFFAREGAVWGADDDTDIEYMYQYLLEQSETGYLTPSLISEGWQKHIYTNEDAPLSPHTFVRENYLWVSNETALKLMRSGVLPPGTSEPTANTNFDKIDAQLTTEIFGLFAPSRPDLALKMAYLPVRTTARQNAAWIAEFYIAMHALASSRDTSLQLIDQILQMSEEARSVLPEESYAAKMYDFVKQSYLRNPDKSDWERTRDVVFERYQQNSNDGYEYQQPYDAGINFAASLISLFYGGGDIKRTIQIGTLAGWDSDNPTATWGGLLGFLIGKDGVEKAFEIKELSDAYWIHRTRRNFPDRTPHEPGEDTFSDMAMRAIAIVDRVVTHQMGGHISADGTFWMIPSEVQTCQGRE